MIKKILYSFYEQNSVFEFANQFTINTTIVAMKKIRKYRAKKDLLYKI